MLDKHEAAFIYTNHYIESVSQASLTPTTDEEAEKSEVSSPVKILNSKSQNSLAFR